MTTQTPATPVLDPVRPEAPATPRPRRPRRAVSGETIAALGFFVWALAVLSFMVGLVFILSTPSPSPEHWRRLALLLALGCMLSFGALLMLVLGAVRWAGGGALLQHLRETQARQAEHDQLLQMIAERVSQSEVTKRIASRTADADMLRRAIREDIEQRAFDSALVLVNDLAQAFGLRYEAEQFREQIALARKVETEQKVAAAITQLDEILARKEFDRATAEAAKLQRLYPDSPGVRHLETHVREAREQHKHDLERQFLEAAQKDDVDRAIELLKNLDKYLSSAEAEPFRETARGVIGKKRDNLGVQFKMAVHDREWIAAVRVGEQIIREFPNTRMADEVRGLLDVLRERAAAQQAARVPGV